MIRLWLTLVQVCPDAQSPDIDRPCVPPADLLDGSPGGELAFTGFSPWLFWLAMLLLLLGAVVHGSDWYAGWRARRRSL